MPRIEKITSDEEDDIWDYRSQKQRKSMPDKSQSTRNQVIAGVSVKVEKSSTEFKSRINKVKRKIIKKNIKKEVKHEETPDRKHTVDRSGRCPVCQMPFSILSLVETPSWHVDQCLEVPYSSKNECQQGMECNCEIISHYKKFRHTQLARSQRKNSAAKSRGNIGIGNVDKAKVRLTFDADRNEDVLDSSDSDICIIDLVSSQGASDDDLISNVGEKPRPSAVGVDSENEEDFFTATKHQPDLPQSATIINQDNAAQKKTASFQPDLVSDTADVDNVKTADVDNANFDDELDGYDSDVVELPDIQVGDDDFTKVEAIDLVSDNSNGSSVHDVHSMFQFDETREISDMISDALSRNNSPVSDPASDNLTCSDDDTQAGHMMDDSEDDREPGNMMDKVNDDREPGKVIEDSDDDGEGRKGLDDSDNNLFDSNFEIYDQDSNLETYDQYDRDDSPLPSSCVDRDDGGGKTSAISKLRETPEKSRTNSESSTDWEILKSTLTPSTAFLGIELHSNLNISPNESEIPKKKDTLNENVCDTGIVKDKQNEPKGFFANLKKLQKNMLKNKQNDTASTSKIDRTELNYESNSSKDLKVIGPSKGSMLSESDKKGPDDTPVYKQDPDLIPRVENSVQATTKRTANNDTETFQNGFQAKKPKLEKCTPVKSNVIQNNFKRKNIKKEKNEPKASIKSVASYFIPKTGKTAVTIATDDESSGECDRFCAGQLCCDHCSTKNSNTRTTKDKRTSSSCKLHTCSTAVCSNSGVCLPGNRGDNLDARNCCCNTSSLKIAGNLATNNLSQDRSQKFTGNLATNNLSQDRSQKFTGNLATNNLNQDRSQKFTGNRATNNLSQSKVGSVNNSLSLSQSTPDFGIQNVCTVSPTMYTMLQGGFIPDNDDHKAVDNASTYTSTSGSMGGDRGYMSQTSSRENFLPGTMSCDNEVQSILKIQKSATDILMESAKLLYKKTTGLTCNNSKDTRNSVTKSVNDVLMQRSGSGSSRTMSSRSSVDNQSGRGRGRTTRDVTTDSDMSRGADEVKRKCPFYKKMPDTSFTVDAFRYGNIPDCKAYILSHFHYDHYGGLTKRFQNPIYCSKVHCGNFLEQDFAIMLDCCPGAVLILFKLKTGKVYLHTGDFRAGQEMELYPELQNLRVNCLYLDTTYCDPQYDFPPQVDVIKFTVKLALDTLASNPKTLIVCGSYTIGKERIFMAIAQALNCKVCVTRDKSHVMSCLEDDDWKQRVSLKWDDSGIHVLPMNKLNIKGLQEHLRLHGKRFTNVLAIEPTGWTHSKKVLSLHHIKPKLKKENVTIYGVPYSEHSSFLEMKRFYQFIKPDKVLPTVNNGNVHSRRKMEVIFEAWLEDLASNHKQVDEQRSVKGWMK